MGNFDTISSLAIILLAAVVHASFQLSVSVLTLLSGHALGSKTAHHRLLRLTGGFIAGASVMTVLLLSSLSLILGTVLPSTTPLVLWAICCGAIVGVGISVWLFYYRDNHHGTSLWVPRGFARYLADRSKATKMASETFGLGLTSVIAELIFVFAPIVVASLVLIRLSPDYQLLGILLYSVVSLLPLFVVGALIGSGHKLSHIQRWRESNKRFLQFAAGSGLLVLGAYVYVEQVIVVGVAAMGGQ
ncbi:MAG: rane protein of unknown function [Candidatus Saccharibacteria bacterium]|nr:rane protein of unknown function [Candidatus Saccharibacteria bacterium]